MPLFVNTVNQPTHSFRQGRSVMRVCESVVCSTWHACIEAKLDHITPHKIEDMCGV